MASIKRKLDTVEGHKGAAVFIEGTLQEQRFHDASRGPLLFMRGFAAMGMESTSGLKDSLLPGSRQTTRSCVSVKKASREEFMPTIRAEKHHAQ